MAEVEVKARVYWRDEIGRFAEAVDDGAAQAIQQAALDGLHMSQIYAPKKTGRLAGAIRKFGGGTQAGWEAGHEVYMIAQEEGAVPHAIGKEGEILFNAAESFGPVKGPVMHPGNPATHYIARAFEIISRGLAARVQRNLP